MGEEGNPQAINKSFVLQPLLIAIQKQRYALEYSRGTKEAYDTE